jgi:hypothetical protein
MTAPNGIATLVEARLAETVGGSGKTRQSVVALDITAHMDAGIQVQSSSE